MNIVSSATSSGSQTNGNNADSSRRAPEQVALVSATSAAAPHETAPSNVMTPFEAVNFQFDRAARQLGLSEQLQISLKTPFREVMVQIPQICRDGGMPPHHHHRQQHY